MACRTWALFWCCGKICFFKDSRSYGSEEQMGLYFPAQGLEAQLVKSSAWCIQNTGLQLMWVVMKSWHFRGGQNPLQKVKPSRVIQEKIMNKWWSLHCHHLGQGGLALVLQWVLLGTPCLPKWSRRQVSRKRAFFTTWHHDNLELIWLQSWKINRLYYIVRTREVWTLDSIQFCEVIWGSSLLA